MTQLFDLNARIQQLTWSLIFYEKYSTSLLTIVLVVFTTANFGGFSNFCRYYTRSQTGKSTGYRPTLKPLISTEFERTIIIYCCSLYWYVQSLRELLLFVAAVYTGTYRVWENYYYVLLQSILVRTEFERTIIICCCSLYWYVIMS